MTLNEGQAEALNNAVQYVVTDSPYNYFLLEGVAGSGKTVAINEIIDTIQRLKPQLRIAMTATTHAAVKVLKGAAVSTSSLSFHTIHSLCNFRQNINGVTGKVTYVRDESRVARIEYIDLLIVDEVSMLDAHTFKAIEYFRSKRKMKVILVGDSEQLEPVGEVSSMVFIRNHQIRYKIMKHTLTEVMRQAKDNPIIAYATSIRLGKKFRGSGIDYLPVSLEPLRSTLKQYFVSEKFSHDANHVKVLAYRNFVVNRFNTIIRELVHGEGDLPKILVNECLIVDKPVVKYSTHSGKWEMVLATNESVKVVDVIDDNYPVNISYKLYDYFEHEVTNETIKLLKEYSEDMSSNDRLALKSWDGNPMSVHVREWRKFEVTFRAYRVVVEYMSDTGCSECVIEILHEVDMERFREIQDSIKTAALHSAPGEIRKKLWSQYHNMENYFAWVKYNYAITVHKSQGSTYTNAIVHEWDINTQKDENKRRRLRYVAATRASQQLYIVNY